MAVSYDWSGDNFGGLSNIRHSMRSCNDIKGTCFDYYLFGQKEDTLG